jgi:undecaprenyl-diphosphatase
VNAYDIHALLWLNLSQQSPDWLMDMARFGSTVWPKAVLLTVLAALVVGPGRWRRAALHMLLAMLLAWLIVRGISTAWPMPRPFVLGLGEQWLAKEPSASFPSSHASIAWAISAAGCFWVRHPLVVAGFLLSALLVAWSRVALGVHFPSDMLAGMAVGVFSAWAMLRPTRWLASRLGTGFSAAALPLR